MVSENIESRNKSDELIRRCIILQKYQMWRMLEGVANLDRRLAACSECRGRALYLKALLHASRAERLDYDGRLRKSSASLPRYCCWFFFSEVTAELMHGQKPLFQRSLRLRGQAGQHRREIVNQTGAGRLCIEAVHAPAIQHSVCGTVQASQ